MTESLPPAGEPTLAALCETVREALAKATPGEESHATMRRLTEQYIDGDGALYFVRIHQVALHFLLSERDQFKAWLARLVDEATTWSGGYEAVALLNDDLWEKVAALRAKVREMEAMGTDDLDDQLMSEVWMAVRPANFSEEECEWRWGKLRQHLAALRLAVGNKRAEVTALQSKLADAERERERMRAAAVEWQGQQNDAYSRLKSQMNAALQMGKLLGNTFTERVGYGDTSSPVREAVTYFARAALSPPVPATHQEEGRQ